MPELIAKLKVQPGKEDEFEAAAKEMIQNVGREEAGTMVYSLHRKAGEPGTYVFYERYNAQSDLDAHGKTPHMAHFGGKIRDCLAGRPELEMLELVAELER